MITRLRHVVETLILLTSLTLLGGICLSWTLVALPLLLVLPPGPGRRCGRLGILLGFRLYVWTLILMGAYRLDLRDRKSTRLNSSHVSISYAVFCLKKKRTDIMAAA